ncbi:MAG TPA: alpha-L-fucosidase, partial [Anaerolineae bacterium]|nr:alpha-L-fucosidase [Anaerolineae bacterium]
RERFFRELPRTFYPRCFDPDAWAALAQIAGMRYVVFTTKHHSGFCMFDTQTTDFNVMNTPFGQDVTRRVVEAFRKRGIAIGFYFSPDDFSVLHRQGKLISRRRPEALPSNNPELMAHNLRQMRELLTNYGPIDIVFLDGEAAGLRELCWELQPELLVTRGAMPTPEQHLPDQAPAEPWEACFTMGTQWHFKPTNETYKSGRKLIEMLIETRAKGGNLLINVGPAPDGEIPFEQDRILRELALWLFINGEAIYDVVPWDPIREGDIWFTKAREADTAYALITGTDWTYRERKNVTIESVWATEDSEIEVLGQSGQVLEYRPEVVPRTEWRQVDGWLTINATRAQRIYNDGTWSNPPVLRITHARHRGG